MVRTSPGLNHHAASRLLKIAENVRKDAGLLRKTLELSQTRKMPPVVVILDSESNWLRAFNPKFLVEGGVIGTQHREFLWPAETPDGIWHDLPHWHELKGAHLYARHGAKL